MNWLASGEGEVGEKGEEDKAHLWVAFLGLGVVRGELSAASSARRRRVAVLRSCEEGIARSGASV